MREKWVGPSVRSLVRVTGALVCLLVSGISLADRDALRGARPTQDRAIVRVAPPMQPAALVAGEEARRRGGQRPYRVASPIATDLGPANAGTWQRRNDGGWRWRMELQSDGALWTMVGFDLFRLERGASLRVYAPDGRAGLGPYTAADVRPHGELWLPPVAGDRLVVELDWPDEQRPTTVPVHLGTVTHGFLPWGGIGEVEPLGASDCHIDINCPLGDDWQREQRGVVQMVIGTTGALCSGSLINNTNLDCTPYVLTADHCFDDGGTGASTAFHFDYELPACEPGSAPLEPVVTDAALRASHPASDHRLLELSGPAPPGAFFNGWSRSTTPASESWTIHHPLGGFKKITHDADPLVDGIDQGPDHWRVGQWEDGSTDPGSSGGPLFDPQGRIVGELHVDTASCDNPTGYAEFGKFNVAWTNGLSGLLDPGASGAIALDGMDQSFCGAPAPRLSYVASVVDDAAGSNNGLADPGETFALQVRVLNDGPTAATGVSGSLTTAHSLVTMQDDSATWSDIAAYATLTGDSPHFTVELDAGFSCGESIPFQLDMTSNEGSWQSDFLLPTGLVVGLEAPPPFEDDMESGVNGWTTQELVGSSPWTQSTAQSGSPTHSWFVPDVPGVRDSVLVMPTVSSVPPLAELSFAHRLNTDSGDGGVLEYTTDGFSWLDAGNLVTTGPYNSRIATFFASPIGGRDAWAGDLGGWRTVRVDLSTLEGEMLTLRWRFVSDNFSGGVGWYVDDVVLDSPVFECIACIDGDGDGFCPEPAGDDCNDGDDAVYPGAPQICDGLNNDCDDPLWPDLPANEIDGDADGMTFCAGDCNGADPAVRPGATELCDGRDNDCDGAVDNDPGCDLSCDASEPAGQELSVTADPSTSVQPRPVWNGNGYGVVWSDARDGNLELFFSRLDAFGREIVGEVQLTSGVADTDEPSLVWNGAEYAVSWCDQSGTSQVHFARFDTDGNVLGSEVSLGSCLSGLSASSLTWNGHQYALAWTDSDSEVRFSRLDASGIPLAGGIVLSDGTGNARAPSMVWNGTEYGVAWRSRDGSNRMQVFFTRVDTLGAQLGGELMITSSTDPSRRPVLVWNGSGYALAYNEGSGSSRWVLLQRLDAVGALVGAATQVSDGATGSAQPPGLAWSGGEYGLIWHDTRHGARELYFSRVDASGNEIGAETRLTDSPFDSEAGGLVWTGKEYGLVWGESPQIRFKRLGCNCFDPDGDSLSSCNDNCSLIYNPDQADLDDDFEGDPCDVDDGQIYILVSVKTQVGWDQEQGYDSWSFYKGDLDVLKTSGPYTQAPGSNALADRQCGLGTTQAEDIVPPAPGKTAFFLVAGVSGGVEGDLGQDSAGSPRPNDNPCP
jgi:hypothetical protein